MSGTISASVSEKHASSPALARKNPASAPRLRSCVTCRSRKVRCDKLSPCSNCRRANIVCVVPSSDHPPRWARRLERIANGAAATAVASESSDNQTSQVPQAAAQTADPRVDQVMERLRTLEALVTELNGQLEQAHSTANSVAGSSPGLDRNAEHQQRSSSSPASEASSFQKQFGRLVLEDANRSRYISSSFWSRVSDELDVLKMETHGLAGDDSDTSEDEEEPAVDRAELESTPLERHAFLFRHNLGLSGSKLSDFRPLPSQIPFLLEVFAENVNLPLQILHMPTITRMVRDLRGSDEASLTPSNEALMLSIYYAAITSMEEDDVMTNFGSSKQDLNVKYRRGLEYALAAADFLNEPDLVLVQALAIFLCLLRRHESPRFVWMMMGLLIRMAQALGLQRDGSHFPHLSPYEIEMRRRAWWCVCMLDIRASEDQGTEFTITDGSFDTRLPLNINDSDIGPESAQAPAERQGLTDMSFALMSFSTCGHVRQMMALTGKEDTGLDRQSQLLNAMYEHLQQEYLQYASESCRVIHWVAVTITQLVVAKMTLYIYLPVLFFSPSDRFSDEVRAKLLTAAIEVAEYNHALNAEPRCRQWRWGYQTYTHWHAIVYLLIDVSRRPWSPMVERAWVALHSSWLIPAQSYTDKSRRIWVPLRKLMSKARKHRQAELARINRDPAVAEQLERDDRRIPVPASPGPFPAGSDAVQLFRERWRQLVAGGVVSIDNQVVHSNQPIMSGVGLYPGNPPAPPLPPTAPADWFGPGMADFVPCLWPEDSGDVGDEVDWYNWVESARSIEPNI